MIGGKCRGDCNDLDRRHIRTSPTGNAFLRLDEASHHPDGLPRRV